MDPQQQRFTVAIDGVASAWPLIRHVGEFQSNCLCAITITHGDNSPITLPLRLLTVTPHAHSHRQWSLASLSARSLLSINLEQKPWFQISLCNASPSMTHPYHVSVHTLTPQLHGSDSRTPSSSLSAATTLTTTRNPSVPSSEPWQTQIPETQPLLSSSLSTSALPPLTQGAEAPPRFLTP